MSTDVYGAAQTASPFNWRATYANKQTQFAAAPSHRTPLYSKWCQTGMTVPWPQYRDKHTDKAKLERRVYAMPKSSIALQKSNPSRIPDIPKAQRSSK